MLSWIVYGVGASVIGLVLGFGWLTFFGHPSKVDRPIGYVLIKAVLFGVFAPFLWVEGLTHYVGKKFEPYAKYAYNNSKLQGPMRYYKVVSYTKYGAKILVFGQEEDRGFVDNTVLEVRMKPKGTEWMIEDTQVLVSNRLNKDMLVLPPYY